MYVGESQNLRTQFAKQLDDSENKGLVRWLGGHGVVDLPFEYHLIPAGITTRIRKVLKAELMQAVFPEFEYSPGEKESWLRKF
jgi:hypothetical protein